jgi:hypothetical protein
VVLETDSSGVATKLGKEERYRLFYGPLVEEIKLLLKDFEDASVCALRRTPNVVAHVLAKEGCKNKVSRFWLDTPLASIVKNLVLDVLVI